MEPVAHAFMPGAKGIQILMIEDVPADVELIEAELRKGGLGFHARQVDSREEFLRELQRDPPDVILSDHGLHSFDGFTALAIARDRCPDVPFIFVSGHLGEENAIMAFESGAADCVLKGQLSKLAPAIQRALHRRDERRNRVVAEAERERALREVCDAVAKVKPPECLLPICAHCKRIRDNNGAWHTLEAYFHRQFAVEFTHGLCPQCVPMFLHDGR